MITPSDSYNTYDLGNIILFYLTPVWDIEEFIKEFQAKKVQEDLVIIQVKIPIGKLSLH